MENENQNTSGQVIDNGGVRAEPLPVDLGGNGVIASDANSLSAIPQGSLFQETIVGPEEKPKGFKRLLKPIPLLIFALLVSVLAIWASGLLHKKNQDLQRNSVSTQYDTQQIPLTGFVVNEQGVNFGTSNVVINGPLQANGGLVVTPTTQPANAVAGQLYYDQGSNRLSYYNGSKFVSLDEPQAQEVVQSLGGATGQLTIGGGLGVVGNQLINRGVLSLGGASGAINVGNGLAIVGNALQNSGVLSIVPGSGNVSVSTNANGQVTIDMIGAGTGTVTSGGGTSGRLPLFTASQNIENSIISQTGLTVTVSGDLSVVTGGLSLSNALTVSNGGTGTNSLSSNGVIIGGGTGPLSSVTAGSSNLCLLSTAGAPIFAACPSASGVTTLNGLNGAVSIGNAGISGSTILINDAGTSAKGIASFDDDNFDVSGGAVNTAQDIHSGASPTFVGVNTNSITPSAGLTVGVSAQTALLQGSTTTITSSGVGNNIILNSANTIELQDNTNVTGNVVASGDVAVNGGDLTSSGALNITPGGALTVGVSGQNLTLQGNASASFRATNAGNTTIVGFTSPTANTTLNFPALAAGTYTICTSSGNCAGPGASLQSAYNNSSDPEIVLDATRAAVTIRDAGSALGTNLLEVQDNAGTTTYLAVTATGIAVTGSASVTGNIDTTSGSLQTGGTTRVDSSGNLLNIGSISLSGGISGGTSFTGSGNINTTGGVIQTNSTTRIDNSGNLVNIAGLTASGNATLQGGTVTLGTNAVAGAIVLNDGSSNTGTLQTAALAQNTVYTLPDPGGGTATICLTTGNCAGAGGGVTGSGSNNRLSKFTSTGSTVGDSTITDDGTTVSTTVDLIIQGGDATIGVANSQTGTLRLADGASAFIGSLTQGPLTASRTYTLPDSDGTICLSTGNCLGGGGGANTSLSNLTSVAINTTLLPGAAGTINLGSGTLPFGDLFLAGTSGTPATNNFRITGASTGGTRTITLPDASGTVCLQNSASCGFLIGSGTAFTQGGNTFGATGTLGTNDANQLDIRTGGNTRLSVGASGGITVAAGNTFSVTSALTSLTGATTGDALSVSNSTSTGNIAVFKDDNTAVLTIANGGAVTFRNQTDSTAAFQVQNAGGSLSVLTVDTTNTALRVMGTGTNGAGSKILFGDDDRLSIGGSGTSDNIGMEIKAYARVHVVNTNDQEVFTIDTQNGLTTVSTLQDANGGFAVFQQNGNSVLYVGTAGEGSVNIGYLADSEATVLYLDSDATSEPAGAPGGMYYNASMNKFRCYENTGWTNCIPSAAGVSTVGVLNSQTKSANGAVISGGSLVLQTADATFPGLVSTGTQTFAGDKTIQGNLNLTTGNQFQINGTQISSANLSNDSNLAKLSASQTFTGDSNAFRTGNNSSNSFSVQDASGIRLLTADTTAGEIELGTSSSLNGALVFNNSSDADTVTITSGALTGSRILTLPDVDGTICTDAGNCAGAGATLQTAYNFSIGGTTPKIKLNNTLNGLDIQDADTTIGTSLFNIRASNGSGLGLAMLSVSNTGQLILQNSANSTTAFQLLTQGGTAVLTGDTQNGRTVLGQSSTLAGTLVFSNASNANLVTLTTAAVTGPQTITLPNSSGSVCLTSGNCAGVGGTGDVLQNGNSFATSMVLGTNDANTLSLETGGVTRLTIAADGSNVTLASNVGLLLQGANAYISNPQGQTDSEAFGMDATVTGADSLAVGTSASTHSGGASTAIGSNASGGINGTAVGAGAESQGNGVALGAGAYADSGGTAIGRFASTFGFDNSIALGRESTVSAANQLVIGSASPNYISQVVIGNGVTSGSPIGFTLQGTAGTGNNVAGASVSIAGGQGTGSANGGDLLFQIAKPGLTGAGLNSLGAVLTLSGNNGSALFKNATDSATALQVQNAAGTETVMTVDTRARSGTGGNLVKIGNSTGTDTAVTILQLDATSANPTSNLSALNGGLFYNSTTNKVSLIENGQIKVICNTTDLGCGTGTVTLQNAYANSLGGTTPEIKLDSTRGGLDIQDADTTIGANLLNVRGSSGAGLGTSYFSVDNSGHVGIGAATPARTLDIATNDSNTTLPALRLLQGGSGDATIELNTPATSIYLGIDNSAGGAFKISSTAANNNVINSGYYGQAPTDTDSGNNGQISTSQITSGGSAGTLNSISVYFTNAVGNAQVGLYADNGSDLPGAFIANSSSQAAVDGWNTFTMPSTSISANTKYWIGFNVTDGSMVYGGLFTGKRVWQTATYGTWPAPYGTPTGTDTGRTYLVYMTYTPAGAVDSFAGNLLSIGTTGQTAFKNSADSTTAFQIQNSSAQSILGVDTTNRSTTNLITNPGFETSTTGWSARNSPITFTSTLGQHHSGSAALYVEGGGNANDGAKFTVTLTDSEWYLASFYAKIGNGDQTMTTLAAGYSSDGSTDTNCSLTSTTVISGGWGRYECFFQTPGSHSGSPYFYVKQTDASSRDMYFDDFLLVDAYDGSHRDTVSNGAVDLQGVISSPLRIQGSSDSADAFVIQNADANTILGISTLDSNIITNSSFEHNALNWNPVGGSTTAFDDFTQGAIGNASYKVTTSATANAGAAFTLGNAFPTRLATSTTYALSWYAKLSSGSFTDIKGRYTRNGTNFVECTPAAQTVSLSGWTRFSCTFTTDGTAPTASADIRIVQTAASAHTFWVDAVRLEQGSIATPYGSGSITLDGVVNSPLLVRTLSDTTTALTVQNTAGVTLFNVDALNNQVSVTTAGTADSQVVTSSNTTGTQTNGILINRNGTGGTTTNGINITQTNGTLTNGLSFGGTIGTDIQRASGTLTLNGAAGINLGAAGSTRVAATTTGADITGIATVNVNNSNVNSAPLKVIQSGTGDSTIQFSEPGEAYYLGVDASDHRFKISSSAAGASIVNLGNFSTGTSTDSGDQNIYDASKFTAGATGTINRIYAYVASPIGPSPNNKGQMAIYSDNAGTPQNRLGFSTGDVTLTGDSWNEFPISPVNVTSGTTYWLVYNSNGASSNQNNLRFDPGTTNQMRWTGTQAYGSWAATWPGTSGSSNSQFTMYAPIEVSGSDNLLSSLFQLSQEGMATFQNSSNSTSAFRVLSSSASSSVPQFSIDTTNSRVYIGNPTADSTGALLVLDSKNTTGDPTGVDGAMYYNSAMGVMRCYFEGRWQMCNEPRSLSWGYNLDEEFVDGEEAEDGTDHFDIVSRGGWVGYAPGATSFVGTEFDPSSTDAEDFGHMGVVGITADGTNQVAQLYPWAPNHAAIALNGGQVIETSIYIENLATGTDDYNIRLGLCNSDDRCQTATSTAHGLFFEYDRDSSANWIMAACTAGTCSRSTSTKAVIEGHWISMRIIVNSSTSATFYVKNATDSSWTTLGTLSSSNIPALPTRNKTPFFELEKENGTNPRYMAVDYFHMREDRTSQR